MAPCTEFVVRLETKESTHMVAEPWDVEVPVEDAVASELPTSRLVLLLVVPMDSG